MTHKTIFLISVISIALVGCQPPSNYYWGNYSYSLYAYKKAPDEKTLLNHKNSLYDIISSSQLYGKQIPPGIYGELGYILLKEGKRQDGINYLQKEMQLFPESRILLNKIIEHYNSVRKGE